MQLFFAFVHVLSAATLATTLSTAPPGLDPIKNFCSRIDHQSVIKNGVLYIDGGTEVFSFNNTNQQGPTVEGYNTFLIAVNMSTSWDWKTNISETLINKTANAKTGTSPPLVVRGALYHGLPKDSNIYLYGGTTSWWNESFPGWMPPSSSQYTLWGYDTTSNAGWSQFDISLEASQRPSSGAFAEAPNLGLAFYYNGEVDSGSSIQTQFLGSSRQQFMGGMVVLNLNNQTARNVSTTRMKYNFPRTRGRMQYIPNIGSKGALINMGGSYKPATKLNSDSIGTLVDMGSIDVFDVNSLYDGSDGSAWYTQQATGHIPEPRIDFCLVMAPAPDGSSYNIYLYGGRDDTNFFDDVYVLSLPSFTWIQIYSGQSPRFGMTCHLVGSRQMITIGGQSGLNSDCDWEVKSVAIYDLSNLIWGSVYNANTPPYTVPNLVTAAIGGNGNGTATVTAPRAGFDSIDLAHVFNSTFVTNTNSTNSTNVTSTAASSAPASTSASSTPSTPATTQTPTAAIVGGVVGGVVGLALIAGLIFFLLRHRRRQRESERMRLDANELSTDYRTQNEKDGATAQPDIDGELDSSIWKPPVELASPQSEIADPQLYAELPAEGHETFANRPDRISNMI